MKISNINDVSGYLLDHMPQNTSNIFNRSFGLERTKYFLKLLGNPQNKIKCIHVAGTSGKSSTSYLLSLFLSVSGRKTGLYISPHINNLRERISINGVQITEDDLIEYLNIFIPFTDRVKESKYGSLTNFEILTALAFYYFWRKKVDYAVIETGLGGLMDATNAIESRDKISVITRIGLDHTEYLGKTINEIAKQKAGIININSQVIAAVSNTDADKVLRIEAKRKNAELTIIKQGINYKNIQETKKGTFFTFNYAEKEFRDLEIGLLGAYQAENCSLALSALILLSKRDHFQISEKGIRTACMRAEIPGRLSTFLISGKNIIIDGAHNPQKMESFLKAVKNIYPARKFDFLIAFTKAKNYKEILKLIVPLAKSITITSFNVTDQDWHQISISAKDISDELKKQNFNNFRTIDNSKRAFESLLHAKVKNDIIITGSFYLISTLNLHDKK